MSASLLIPRQRVVMLTVSHDPISYYREHSGLWVGDQFRDAVLAHAQPTKEQWGFILDVADLGQKASDEQIEGSLPVNHVFDISQLCTIIATMIERQPQGRAGNLHTNGYANLFYTESGVVNVHWRRDRLLWSVSKWDREEHDGWEADRRVFYPGGASRASAIPSDSDKRLQLPIVSAKSVGREAARRKVKELVTRFGPGIADDPRRCEALLRDFCGEECKREIAILVAAAREVVVRDLIKQSATIPIDALIARLSQRLQDNLGLAEEFARWSVESWAIAVGSAHAETFEDTRQSSSKNHNPPAVGSIASPATLLEIEEHRKTIAKLLEAAEENSKQSYHSKAVQICDSILASFSFSTDIVIQEQTATALAKKASILASDLHQFDQAVQVCDALLARLDGARELRVRRVITKGILDGCGSMSFSQVTEVLRLCDQLLERIRGETDPELRSSLVHAMGVKAGQLFKLGMNEELIRVSDAIIATVGLPSDADWRSHGSLRYAYKMKWTALRNCSLFDEAVEVIDEYLGKFDRYLKGNRERDTLNALLEKADIYNTSKRYREASIAYGELATRAQDYAPNKVLDSSFNFVSFDVNEVVADALLREAIALNLLHDLGEAFWVCKDIQRKFGRSENHEVQQTVAEAKRLMKEVDQKYKEDIASSRGGIFSLFNALRK